MQQKEKKLTLLVFENTGLTAALCLTLCRVLYHICPRWELRPPHLQDYIQRGSRKRELYVLRQNYMRENGRCHSIVGLEWWRM